MLVKKFNVGILVQNVLDDSLISSKLSNRHFDLATFLPPVWNKETKLGRFEYDISALPVIAIR